MKLFFYDLETTGLSCEENGIHQISGCIEIDGEVKEYFNYNVQPNPNLKISDEALAVSNKTKEEVMSYSLMSEIHQKITDMLTKYVDKYDRIDKFFLVGYNNSSFDNQFFRNWFAQNGDKYFGSWFWPNTLDVYILATQKLLPERHNMLDFRLQTVCKYVGITIDESKLHDASYDIELTRQLYKKVTTI